jgi:hypothetical protein
MSEEFIIEGADQMDASELKIAEITAVAVLAERRHAAQERERLRLVALEEISPRCVRELVLEVDGEKVGTTICDHKLNRHDPCSGCPCPGFVDAAGADARAASTALIEAHPDLFPQHPSVLDPLLPEAVKP